MKKTRSIFILVLALALCLVAAGCGTKNSRRQQEYKDLAISQLESGEYESALENIQKALDCSLGFVTAKEIDLCLYKAEAQICLEEYEDAIDTYTSLIEYDDDNWEAYYLRGCAYLMTGDDDAAFSDFDQALLLNPSDIELYANIYEKLCDAGLSDEGGGYLSAALLLTPDTAKDYADIGYLYYLYGDDDSAISYLSQAVGDGCKDAYLVMGQVYASLGSTDEALSCFNSYLAEYPEEADAYLEIAQIYVSLGEYGSAADYFYSALFKAEDDAKKSIWKNLIAAYEQDLDFDSALLEAEEFLAEYPDDEDILKEYEFLSTR